MPRDVDSLKIEKWAATGNVQDPETEGIVRSAGWDSRYSVPGNLGRKVVRETMNELHREITALGVELNTHGLLEWSNQIDYVHPAYVVDSDANDIPGIYVSIGSSGPLTSNATRPLTDATNVYWQSLINTIPDPPDPESPPNASTVVRGLVELATTGEAATGTDGTRAVTPLGLASAVPNASTSARGKVELATTAEVNSGTSNSRAVTPSGLSGSLYREITVSDSAPVSTNGSNGDIWLEY